MALPVSRNTSYAPGSQVKSTDLNDLQDVVVGAAHGEIPLAFSPVDFKQVSGSEWTVSNPLTPGNVPQIAGSGGGLKVCTRFLPLRVGDRIKSISMICQDGNTEISFELHRYYNMDTTPAADVLAGVSSTEDDVHEKVTDTLSSPHVVAENEILQLVLGTTGEGSVFLVEVVIDRPLPSP